MNKVIVILGPTASGKSDVAIKLAQKFDGEIISADSRQVYRGMDIGSGKISRDFPRTISNVKLRGNNVALRNDQPASPVGGFPMTKHKELFISEGIIHHLIDVADPNDEFNISHFKKLAEKKIEDILKRGKLPIICGGTGFWIQSIVDNVHLPEVKPDKVLRNMLRNKSTEELFLMLRKLDPERAGNIDAKNKVRLIRAIEICKTLGKVPSLKCHSGLDPESREILKQVQDDKGFNFLQIGIEIEKEVLNEKIKKRLDQRFNEGMIQEVQNLNNPPTGGGVSWERLESFGLEYRWIARYLQNKISLSEMQEKLYFDIIHYAKRQMTWFKKDARILWLKSYAEIENAVQEFLK